MLTVNRFFITVIQTILLLDNTKQSYVKQAMTTVKTIGNTIKSPFLKQIGNIIKKPIKKTFGISMKNSADILCRNKNTMKKLAYSIQDKYLRTKHNFGSKPVKYLRDFSLKKFKSTVPQAVGTGNQLTRAQSKKNIQMRSAGYMRGKEVGSLVNMIVKSKPLLPQFAGGGLMTLTQFNLVATNANPVANDDYLNSVLPKVDKDGVETLDDSFFFPEKKSTAPIKKIFYKGITKRILEFRGMLYEGDIIDGEMQGKGTLTYPNEGDEYEGNFIDGDMQGMGKLIYKNKDVYEGEFVDTIEHGHGKQTKYGSQHTYEGPFVDGRINGLGKTTTAGGDVYEGEHLYDHFKGKGFMTYDSGNTYDGEWLDSKRHGYGEYLSTNGDFYKGFWSNDCYSGDGSYHQKVGEKEFKGTRFYEDNGGKVWMDVNHPGE